MYVKLIQTKIELTVTYPNIYKLMYQLNTICYENRKNIFSTKSLSKKINIMQSAVQSSENINPLHNTTFSKA